MNSIVSSKLVYCNQLNHVATLTRPVAREPEAGWQRSLSSLAPSLPPSLPPSGRNGGRKKGREEGKREGKPGKDASDSSRHVRGEEVAIEERDFKALRVYFLLWQLGHQVLEEKFKYIAKLHGSVELKRPSDRPMCSLNC